MNNNVSPISVLCGLDDNPVENFKKLDFGQNEKSTKILKWAPN